MKVIVKDFLNVRVGAPSVNAPCYQYLAPGSEIEVDGNFYHGDLFEDADIWLKDLAGNYYWRGGVSDFVTPNIPTPASSQFDWEKGLKLSQPIPAKNGDKIKIAILDSGIDLGHPSLSAAVIEKVDFLTLKTPLINDHGSRVAGVIVSNDSVIKGLATGSKLRDYRIIKDGGYVETEALSLALSYLVEKTIDVDILNLSFEVSENTIDKIQSNVNTLADRGCIIVVAGGNGAETNSNVALKNAVFASVFTATDPVKTRAAYNASFLNTTFKSTGIFASTPYREFGNDSAYTAVLTGLIARFLSSNPTIKKEDRLKRVKEFLSESSFSVKNETTFESYKPYKA